ncbi:MFS transporter, partial [Aquibium sp. A9E412]|uniref:MFS transporter n=1 Tax=Aquibium sp. A9E412 TaxID=2976767 RepID=UPI0025B0DF13
RRVLAVVLAAALFSGLVFNGVSISLPKLFDERLAAIAPALSGIGGYTAAVFAVAAFAQLPVGAALDRIGGRPLMIGIYLAAAAALALLAGAAGWPALPAALAAVTLMFAGIPISGWLVARHVPQAWRGRAFAFEYVLALGASALVVPAMAALHGLGFGFTWQYLILAAAAAMVALAGLLLPRPARPPRPRPAPRAG